jgi:hypothetical protein
MEIFYPKGFALIHPKKALKEMRDRCLDGWSGAFV